MLRIDSALRSLLVVPLGTIWGVEDQIWGGCARQEPYPLYYHSGPDDLPGEEEEEEKGGEGLLPLLPSQARLQRLTRTVGGIAVPRLPSSGRGGGRCWKSNGRRCELRWWAAAPSCAPCGPAPMSPGEDEEKQPQWLVLAGGRPLPFRTGCKEGLG